MREPVAGSVAATAAAAAAGMLGAAASAAVVGEAGKDDKGDDYPDEALVVLKEVAKAVHNIPSLYFFRERLLAVLINILCPMRENVTRDDK